MTKPSTFSIGGDIFITYYSSHNCKSFNSDAVFGLVSMLYSSPLSLKALQISSSYCLFVAIDLNRPQWTCRVAITSLTTLSHTHTLSMLLRLHSSLLYYNPFSLYELYAGELNLCFLQCVAQMCGQFLGSEYRWKKSIAQHISVCLYSPEELESLQKTTEKAKGYVRVCARYPLL